MGDVFSDNQLGTMNAHILDEYLIKLSPFPIESCFRAGGRKILAGKPAGKNVGGGDCRNGDFFQISQTGIIAEIQFVAFDRIRQEVIRTQNVEGK